MRPSAGLSVNSTVSGGRAPVVACPGDVLIPFTTTPFPAGWTVATLLPNPTKLASLGAGRMPIYELGLDQLVATNVKARRLAFTDDWGRRCGTPDAVFIALGTPIRLMVRRLCRS
jgi:hypothetical protein